LNSDVKMRLKKSNFLMIYFKSYIYHQLYNIDSMTLMKIDDLECVTGKRVWMKMKFKHICMARRRP